MSDARRYLANAFVELRPSGFQPHDCRCPCGQDERVEKQKNSREVFVPLSLRRAVTDAIEAARPAYRDQTLASAQAEAAIDAMRPFVEKLLAGAPHQPLPNPSDDGDGLENGGN